MSKEALTVVQAAANYLDIIRQVKSPNTHVTYRKAIHSFQAMLRKNNVDPEVSPASDLTEDVVADFAMNLKKVSPATERLYIQAVKGFYKFLVGDLRISAINMQRLDLLLENRVRKPGVRIIDLPGAEIEKLLDQMEHIESTVASGSDEDPENAKLRAYRDRAFLITLADTGFRVHEACNLRRGDVNWNEGYAIIIGKGDKQAVVRFTSRALRAIKDYLSLRAVLDGASGKQLSALPVFARHDKAAGKKIKPMTPTTGRNIVRDRVGQFLGKEMVGEITPHTFRHYFVTSALRATGNLRIAQELARHKNIQVTQRYTHLTNEELDKAYYDAFENKSKTQSNPLDKG